VIKQMRHFHLFCDW